MVTVWVVDVELLQASVTDQVMVNEGSVFEQTAFVLETYVTFAVPQLSVAVGLDVHLFHSVAVHVL